MAGRLFLTEFELMILLAIARLDENAYGVLIAREIEAATKRSVMLAAVYGALERLEAKDLVSSALGEATPERGGRAKRFFRVTRKGHTAMTASQRAFTALWSGLPSRKVRPV